MNVILGRIIKVNKDSLLINTDNKTIELNYQGILPIRKYDIIIGYIVNDSIKCEPLVYPGKNEEVIKSELYSYYNTRSKANKILNLFYQVYNTKDIYDILCKESIRIDNVITLEFGNQVENIKGFLNHWYYNQTLRRLKLLTLTNDQIILATDFEYYDLITLYNTLTKNPNLVLSITDDQMHKLINDFQLHISDSELHLSNISRKLFRISRTWSCCPLHEVTWLKETNLFTIKYNSIYLPHQLELEEGLSKYIKVESIGKEIDYIDSLDEYQNKALNMALTNKFSIITGKAGTGKSTVIGEIAKRSKNCHISSFTGKAVARLSELIDKKLLSTLHMLLKDDKAVEHLIIDEASMVCDKLLLDVLKHLDNDKLTITLVGDYNQLPPIMPGDIFTNLTFKIPTVELKINHRVEDTDLDQNINRLKNGEDIDWNKFAFFKGDLDKIIEICKYMTDKGIDHTDIKIISPINSGLNWLNSELSNIFISKGEEVTDVNGNIWKRGMRVMMIKNNYNINVMNGEEGIIEYVTNDKVIVNFNNKDIEFNIDNVGISTKYITLSWAITVHKSQGSEWDNVIFYLPNGSYGNFINNRLIYTGITRFRKRLIIVSNNRNNLLEYFKIKNKVRYSNLDKIIK